MEKKRLIENDYQKKFDTIFYAYQVVIKSSNGVESFIYGKYSRARRFYNEMKLDKRISVEFTYFCSRYDNSGRFRIGMGKTRKDARIDSLIDYSKLIPSLYRHEK